MNKWNRFSVFFSCLVLRAVPMAAQTVFKDGIASVNVTRALNGNNATDQFNLTALKSPTCNDRAKLMTELSADCVPVFPTTGLCELSCQCKQGTSSFILWEKRCADERKFRRGCRFVFGSWTWANGWSWNSWHDSLQILYVGNGFGLTAGFNASTNTFSTCVLKSTTLYNATGEWEAAPVKPHIVFFKLYRIWHLSWQLSGNESEIEGKFVKLEISCGDKNTVNDSTESIVNSSCVIIKAAGHLTHQYNITRTTSSNTPTVQASITTTPMTNQYSIAGTTTSSTPTVQASITTTPMTNQYSTVGTTSSSNTPTVLASTTTTPTNQYSTVGTTSSSTPTVQASITTTPYQYSTVGTTSSSTPTVQASITTTPTSMSKNQYSTVGTSRSSTPTVLASTTMTPTNQYSTVGTTSSSTPTVPANITTTPTTSNGYDYEDPHIGLIIGSVAGGTAMLLIITAAAIFVVSYANASRVKDTRSSRIALAYYKGSVRPEPV